MKPNNPVIKYIVRMIYFAIFCGISFVITIAFTMIFSILIILLRNNGIDLSELDKIFPIIIGLMLLAYSFWLAKESSIAFSENNCFFFEAVFVSIKKTVMYLPFIPIIGKYFDKRQGNEDNQDIVKKI